MAAGLIDSLATESFISGERAAWSREHTGPVLLGVARALHAGRRGDLLAALSQETIGDHGIVRRTLLDEWESRSLGTAARIPRGLGDSATLERVYVALAKLRQARVIAIMRAKHEDRTVARAAELASLGFTALEVTCDSAGFR